MQMQVDANVGRIGNLRLGEPIVTHFDASYHDSERDSTIAMEQFWIEAPLSVIMA